VLAVTSSATNQFTVDGSSGTAYLVVVIDPGAKGGARVLVGRGGFTVAPGAPPPTEYPVTWSWFTADDLGLSSGGTLHRATKDTDLGFAGYDGTALPAAPTERVLIYRQDTLYVLGLEDVGTAGAGARSSSPPPRTPAPARGRWGTSTATGHS
jgi:hypothetical protein